jgi:ankyrin repeat protein
LRIKIKHCESAAGKKFAFLQYRDALFPPVGATPMDYAAYAGNVEVMRYLIDHGADPAISDERGTTPLHNAAEEGALSCYLVSLKSKGMTLLENADTAYVYSRRLGLSDLICICIIFVVPPGHSEAVRLLLSKGVPVDPIDHQGAPLHVAIAKDRPEAVKVLLEHGADVSLSVPL